MGRHSSPKPNKTSSLNKSREASLNKLYELEDQAHAHLKESLGATRICTVMHNKETVGKDCPFCKGTMLVPDVARRNWAFEEINTRISPKPKAVEITSEDNSQESDEKALEGLTNKELEQVIRGYETSPHESK